MRISTPPTTTLHWAQLQTYFMEHYALECISSVSEMFCICYRITAFPPRVNVTYYKISHAFFLLIFCCPVSPTHVSLFMIQTPIISADVAGLVLRPSPFRSCPPARCVSTARKRSSHVAFIHVARLCISGDTKDPTYGGSLLCHTGQLRFSDDFYKGKNN